MALLHGSSPLLCGHSLGGGVPGRWPRDMSTMSRSSLLGGHGRREAAGRLSSSRRRVTVSSLNVSTSSVEATNSDIKEAETLVGSIGVALDNLPVKPARVQSGIGLISKRELWRGEEILAVPRKSWITVATVKESPIGSAVEGQRPWVCLALFLLWERSNLNSPWKSYFKLLPAELNSTLFWSDEELAELQGTQLLGSTLSFKEFVETEFERVRSEVLVPNMALFDPSVFNLEAFSWAFGILRSRTFPPLTGEDLALVPLADFINHGAAASDARPSWELRKGTGFFGSQDALVVRAQGDFRAGQEVVMDYGAEKGNGQLALEYGFVESAESTAAFLQSQSRDCFTLTLEIPEGDRFADDKVDIADINGFGASVSFDLVCGQGPSEDMLTYLRLMVLDGPDAFLLEALFRDAAWGHISLPVSRENEEGICTAMLDGCRAALEGYGTSVDEDVRLLAAGIDDPRLKVAVVVRLGEKRVLQELQGWFEAHLARLDKLEYYAERRLRDLGLLDDKGFMTPWVFNE
ncbi:[ribulose-bisphosphate carboxylase]/[fructose-bisphosphate aldolase]-lysine N-methyltransferase [Marchantia polymorpha subsp. ruderalis]|uniref:SET domain-containing protein n=2 Tax=Marchantia polymorpha TaxID=3197 RepID=A0AAF6AT93_MARPO|nr:hypothetical protein MARPO_0065s0091 [Marchantia polymorpha]BBM99663.1 hypothetical protein Mp_1g22860 [Marchantia polymorpha subsp. ruderalis]|eukprot:PTQ36295.1 hypothetical protein MARPO_0065s0091 [Marchantia polymorpha]